jgi:hypothetical protein
MNPNFRDLTREKKEVQMKIRVMRATTLATMKKMAFTILGCTLLMFVAAPAWADQCSAPSVGTGTGVVGSANGPDTCGALITVTAVDSFTGNATAFTVTIPSGSNGNPYDGADDTLVGIQNNSGGPLKSIKLSSPDTTFGGIFAFETPAPGDGPCAFNPADCFRREGGTGYEGPHNTFATSENKTMGTVNFVLTEGDSGIPAGGSTWFALEGTPLSLTTISQTFILQPGVTVSVPVGNNLYKFKPIDNIGGELFTITAFPIRESVFDNILPDPPDTCAPVKDASEAAGADTCFEFQHDCAQGTASTNDCDAFTYQVKWIFDLPLDRPAIGGVDWGIKHGAPCPVLAGGFDESIFAGYTVSKTDPVFSGGDHRPSCNAPEWTRGATPITTAAGFVGFEPPVSNTKLNRIEAEETVPLKWDLSDRFGIPITNLTLCTNPTDPSCTAPWVMLQSTRIACPGKKTPKKVGLKLLDGDFKNQGDGEYRFNWETDEDSRGCVTVVLNFELAPGAALVTVSPANFKFKLDE